MVKPSAVGDGLVMWLSMASTWLIDGRPLIVEGVPCVDEALGKNEGTIHPMEKAKKLHTSDVKSHRSPPSYWCQLSQAAFVLFALREAIIWFSQVVFV